MGDGNRSHEISLGGGDDDRTVNALRATARAARAHRSENPIGLRDDVRVTAYEKPITDQQTARDSTDSDWFTPELGTTNHKLVER